MAKVLPPPSDDDPVLDPIIAEDDAPISVPDSTDNGESGRLKTIVQLVKRCLGVKDIAAMRISLPASLLEPVPNLEYWQYLDRPDLFAAINDSTDPFERMLAVLRFAFSKDLKFVHGKVCKPYNSVLGEHFRAHWTIKAVSYPSDPTEPPICHSHLQLASPSVAPSESASFKSSSSKRSRAAKVDGLGNGNGNGGNGNGGSGSVTPGSGDLRSLGRDLSRVSLGGKSNKSLGDADSTLTLGEEEGGANVEMVRVVFLTEQVSHHPPISSYFCAVPDKGIEAVGVDQISAKVSGTTVRVQPGIANQGIFVSLKSGPGVGETYQITHPVANVNGLLRGNPYPTISESTIITCTGAKGQHLRAIIEYKDESWIGRAQFLVEGVIHEYDPEETEHEQWLRVKNVPSNMVIATFEGSWKKRVRWKRAGESTLHTLIDLSTLGVVPKAVRPIEAQGPFESRKLWEKVTTNLLSKNYNEATKHKQTIEQAQRDLAAHRKKTGVEFKPVYFHPDIATGAPVLTDEGRRAVEEELQAKP